MGQDLRHRRARPVAFEPTSDGRGVGRDVRLPPGLSCGVDAPRQLLATHTGPLKAAGKTRVRRLHGEHLPPSHRPYWKRHPLTPLVTVSREVAARLPGWTKYPRKQRSSAVGNTIDSSSHLVPD